MSLRVLLTADPVLPVPPPLYGGIERAVDLLVRGLRARGHHVTLVAHPDSQSPCDRLVPYGAPPHRGRVVRAIELAQVGRILLANLDQVDVVHSFGRLAALLPILPARRPVKVQTYQRAVPRRGVRLASAVGRGVGFTACSQSLKATAVGLGPAPWWTVHNGVDLGHYEARSRVAPDAPLVFLGRLEPVKGVHDAIAIARRAERRLVIAGNRVEDGSAAGYFDAHIAPHLDGQRVSWVGPIGDATKAELLGGALALIMAIGWEEPFGIVMIEALACGTPVIGYPRGSVPEIVIPGVNGALVSGVDAAARAVEEVSRLDRRAVRADCERRFDHRAIAEQYERIYRTLLDESQA